MRPGDDDQARPEPEPLNPALVAALEEAWLAGWRPDRPAHLRLVERPDGPRIIGAGLNRGRRCGRRS